MPKRSQFFFLYTTRVNKNNKDEPALHIGLTHRKINHYSKLSSLNTVVLQPLACTFCTLLFLTSIYDLQTESREMA
jgi:hypothetical protein